MAPSQEKETAINVKGHILMWIKVNCICSQVAQGDPRHSCMRPCLDGVIHVSSTPEKKEGTRWKDAWNHVMWRPLHATLMDASTARLKSPTSINAKNLNYVLSRTHTYVVLIFPMPMITIKIDNSNLIINF